MSQMAKNHQTRFPKAFDFLCSDLPTLKTQFNPVWTAFLKNAQLDVSEAQDAVTMGATPPLIWPSNLGSSVWGQFNTDVPNRIEIGIDVLQRFEQDFALQSAQEFLRAKVLHEMCHWGCFRKGVKDDDTAGEAFETAAFTKELTPWFQTLAAAPMAADVFADPQARADALAALISKPGHVLGRNDDPAHAVFSGADVAEAMPRGYRNNNPGNIRVGDAWRGIADPVDQDDFQRREASFCVFREPEWGLRAMAFLLRKYKTEHHLDTPRKIISRWAPASDNNNVESYSQQLVNALNLTSRDDFVDTTNDATLVTMIKTMVKHENGEKPPYAEMQYATALLLLR